MDASPLGSVYVCECLLCDDEEVFLLALLYEEVLAVEEVGGGEQLVGCCGLVLVDAHAAAFDEGLDFALAGEDGGGIDGEVGEFHACLEEGFLDLEVGYACEDIEQCLLVEAEEALLGGFAEEDVGGFDCHFIVFARVYHHGDFLCQLLLQHAAAWVGILLGDEVVYLFLLQRGEYLDVAFGILVGHVEPELVELVGRGVAAVEPHVARFGLAELPAVALGDEGARQREALVAVHAADKLGAGGDVAPLVGTA